MSDPTQIVPVSFDRPGVRRFLDVAARIHRREPNWIAPLQSDALKNLSSRNPFYDHAEVQLWIARRDGQDVGRIAAILDRQYRPPWNEPTGFFGFFESVNDRSVSDALFRAVDEWARPLGLRRLLGPMNPSANDECGLLVQGFDDAPTVLTPYNPAYYPALVEAAGFRKAKDLLAFEFDLRQSPVERLGRIAHRFRERNPHLAIRPVTRRSLPDDLPLIKRIYNEGWEDNWGFTPMTDAEIDWTAGRLAPLLTEGLVWLACEHDQPAGALIALLDFNQVLQPLRGRLLGPGLLRALPFLLGVRHPTRARVLLLGVRPEFRRRGIESVMLHEGLRTGQRLGLRTAEASWVLEDNAPVQQTIAHQGGRISKVYRLYDRPVPPSPGTLPPPAFDRVGHRQ